MGENSPEFITLERAHKGENGQVGKVNLGEKIIKWAKIQKTGRKFLTLGIEVIKPSLKKIIKNKGASLGRECPSRPS